MLLLELVEFVRLPEGIYARMAIHVQMGGVLSRLLVEMDCAVMDMMFAVKV